MIRALRDHPRTTIASGVVLLIEVALFLGGGS